MIYLDSIGIKFLINELKENLLKLKINKIFQFDKNSFSLFFSKKQLFFQIKDNDSIVYIKNDKENGTNFSSSFLLSLKKHLEHSELIDIQDLNDDRIIKFTFRRINLSGNFDTNYLIFEIMGRHSNIFLLDVNYKIINILNNNSSIENKRFYAINSIYETFSTNKEKINFHHIFNTEEEMIDKFIGIGKIFAKDTFNNINLRNKLYNNYLACIFKNKNNLYLTYNPFSKFNEFEKIEFNSLNEACNEYFSKYINISLIENKKNILIKFCKNKIKKLENTLNNIYIDIKKNENFNKLKEKADLLASYIYLIKPNTSSISVFDYINNCDISLNLNPQKSPSENINIYYSKYRKAKNTIKYSNIRLEEVKLEIDYYNSILEFIDKETEYIGLLEIEEELGLIKNTKVKEKKKKRELLKFIIDDFEIFVGRNNIENNYLTFEKAKSYDIWLHTRELPGAHVIISTNKKEVPRNIIVEAAKLAAKHSKGEGKKIIDYTTRNNVKRTNSFANVTFNNFKSIEI